MIGIYKIANNINDKVYIGKSIHIFGRWKQHSDMLKKNKHHSKKFQTFYNEYPDVKFNFEILEICEINELDGYEKLWIDRHDAINIGFNMGYSPPEDSFNRNINKPTPIKVEGAKPYITLFHLNQNGYNELSNNKSKITQKLFSEVIDFCHPNFEIFIHGKEITSLPINYEDDIIEKLTETKRLFDSCKDFVSICIDTNGDELKTFFCVDLIFSDDDKCQLIHLCRKFDYNNQYLDIYDVYSDMFEEHKIIKKMSRFKFCGGQATSNYIFNNLGNFGGEDESESNW